MGGYFCLSVYLLAVYLYYVKKRKRSNCHKLFQPTPVGDIYKIRQDTPEKE